MNLEGLTEKKVPKGRFKTTYYENAAGEIVAKVCTKCGELTSIVDFTTSGRGLGGKQSQCNVCVTSMKYKNFNGVSERLSDVNIEGLVRKNYGRRSIWYENTKGEIIAKVCTICETVRGLDNFCATKNKKGGHNSVCKICYSEKNYSYFSGIAEKESAVNIEGLIRRIAGRKSIWYETDSGDVVAKVCTKCSVTRPLKDFHQSNGGLGDHTSKCRFCEADYRHVNKERIEEYRRNWSIENREKALLTVHRRLARKRSLPEDLTTEQYGRTLDYFANTCALTGCADNLEKEHAVPLSIGRGGTTFGNCYPLTRSLNASKGNKNIFEWFEANRQRFELSQERFDKLIDYLASANAMTVEEYRDYVYWCHANPRSIDEIKDANDGGNRQAI